MYSNRGSNVVSSDVTMAELLRRVVKSVSLKAFADEEPSETPSGAENEETNNTGASQINLEDLMTKVRNEEKKKQYATIERLKNQVAKLTEQHNDDLLKIGGLEKDLEEAKAKLTKAGTSDSEEVKTLKGEIETLTKERDSLAKKVTDFEGQEIPSREEIEAEVRQELESQYAVKEYRLQVLAENKDNLLVPELVIGDSKEAIDASLATALARSNEIKQSLGYTKSGTPDKRKTPKTSSNPAVQTGSGDDIAALNNMDIHSEEYAKLRRSLGLM